ncbi:helix-turn-helix domain-containing protein [Clostridium estertheticum]|uniref:MerR family transcriptional regulator n=1 Tax=Clostridium estertheticum TaxID=238834 RepID=UPI0013E972AD|nr:helix-turn-helix domain-containing protein [Clostridium estertheticum]MBN4049332.1 MerR family transcriptional regulator [bacterium AH-315-N14]MBZ9688158.1 helix-turn-helix domain-containing protein [Clostridium estertheticum]
MTKLYSIGEVSRILNIPPKALRHYDEINLIKPSYIDVDTRYRYYNYEQFFIIDIIRYLNKILYVPLGDVKKLIDENKENDKLLTLLESHKEQLDKKIAELKYSKRITDGLIADIKYREKYPEKNEIYEQYLMNRNFYYIKLDISIYDIDKYVNRNTIDTINIDNSENNVMCSIYSLSKYEKTQKLQVKGFGIFSDKKIPGLKSKILPEGRYITKRFLYSEENCSAALRDLLRYAHTTNIKLDDTVYLVSKMINVSASSKYDYYMDLQIMHLI